MLDLKMADLVDDEPLVCATRDEVNNLLKTDPDLQRPENHILRQYIQNHSHLPHWDKIS